MIRPDGPVMEVLRGMHVETAPVHLARPDRANAGNVPQHALESAASAAEDSLRRGFEEGRAQGHAAGLQAGYEEGRCQAVEAAGRQARAALEKAIAEARAPLMQMQERLGVLAASVEAAMEQCLSAAEDEWVAVCFETIARVLGAAAVQPAGVRAHWDHLMSLSRSGHPVVLHVHPQDATLLEQAGIAVEGERADGERRRVSWVPDPEVALGGCILVTRQGGLDARLETILERCRSALLEARARRASGATGEAGR